MVLSADDGRQALGLARQYRGKLSLLLTDVIMPGMSGLDLAEQLKAVQLVPTLFMSGYTDEMLSKHGIMERGTAIIHKPFSFSELSAKLRELLEQK
jgi:two-component system cell cycle sensor histidine kinase/response regulator CckA